MSSADDVTFLGLQRAIVLGQRERLGPDEGLMRIHLESRLEDIAEQLAALAHEDARQARAGASLMFGGKPVVEAGAIEATFGAEALQAFQRLVSTTAATREGRELNTRGPIPDDEADEDAAGFLSGVFLKGRRFEFQFESGGLISGRIAYTIEDPSVLKPSLETKVIAHMRIVTAGRAGREQRTYYLTGVDPLPENDAPPHD